MNKVMRAMAMRDELPREPQRRETEVDDLTTAAQRKAGQLPMDAIHLAPPRKFWTELTHAVPGRLIEGTLPDDHRARFVLRLPKQWNGGLVLAAASGITDEYSYDIYFSDYLLLRGYAFAVTDKAVRRAVLDGDMVLLPHTPEGHVNRWVERLHRLAELSADQCEKFYGQAPERTIAAGVSNGGYIVRRAAELNSNLFDGAIEISGVFWRANRANLLRELPLALRASQSNPWDKSLLLQSGMPGIEPKWETLAAVYRMYYWEAVMHLFLAYLDPDYIGAVEDYDLDSRPAEVLESISEIENSGDLKIPLVSLAGERDYLISCRNHAHGYRELIESQGKQDLHRLFTFPDACHIDANAEAFPFVTPLMPHAHAAFEELEKMLEARKRSVRNNVCVEA